MERLIIIFLSLLVIYLTIEQFYVYVPVAFFIISYNIILFILDFINRNKNQKLKKSRNFENIVIVGIILNIITLVFFKVEFIIGIFILTNYLFLLSFFIVIIVILILNKYYNLYVNKFGNIMGLIIGITLIIISVGWIFNTSLSYEKERIEYISILNKEIIKGRRGDSYHIYIKTNYGKERFRVDDKIYNTISIVNDEKLKFTIRKGLLGFDNIKIIEIK